MLPLTSLSVDRVQNPPAGRHPLRHLALILLDRPFAVERELLACLPGPCDHDSVLVCTADVDALVVSCKKPAARHDRSSAAMVRDWRGQVHRPRSTNEWLT